MNHLDEITSQRKLKGVSWNDLAKGLPVTGNALRMAFERGKVQPEYLPIIRQNLHIGSAQSEPGDKLNPTRILNESEIPFYIIEHEDRLMSNQTFRLWLTTKIQEGVIKILGDKQ